ncbi:MAG: GTPase HflX [Planctomycetes bacterium]|nr:GTPase HflX [Planctomycetota bacterium]
MRKQKQSDLSVHKERVVLCSLIRRDEVSGYLDPLSELTLLSETAGAEVVGSIVQKRNQPDPKYYVGKGKANELAAVVAELGADTVICDDDLTAVQLKSLESLVNKKIVDRSELILDIFANHARTKQAQLQVELAQLQYNLPRLKRMWTHLERIRGGIGVRGPGERQIESDRRLIAVRIKDLQSELKAIDEHKLRHIHSRKELFTISIVGYTNAGKSTLHHALTGSDVYRADKLFATLDTRTSAWELPGGRKALLSDTVGFIRKLPHHLVASFHATLEETIHAQLLLHVVDASHLDARKQISDVESVLAELYVSDTPTIYVFNKIDAAENKADLLDLVSKYPDGVLISAKNRLNLDALVAKVGEVMALDEEEFEVTTGHDAWQFWTFVEEHGILISRETTDSTITGRFRIRRAYVGEIERMLEMKISRINSFKPDGS